MNMIDTKAKLELPSIKDLFSNLDDNNNPIVVPNNVSEHGHIGNGNGNGNGNSIIHTNTTSMNINTNTNGLSHHHNNKDNNGSISPSTTPPPLTMPYSMPPMGLPLTVISNSNTTTSPNSRLNPLNGRNDTGSSLINTPRTLVIPDAHKKNYTVIDPLMELNKLSKLTNEIQLNISNNSNSNGDQKSEIGKLVKSTSENSFVKGITTEKDKISRANDNNNNGTDDNKNNDNTVETAKNSPTNNHASIPISLVNEGLNKLQDLTSIFMNWNQQIQSNQQQQHQQQQQQQQQFLPQQAHLSQQQHQQMQQQIQMQQIQQQQQQQIMASQQVYTTSSNPELPYYNYTRPIQQQPQPPQIMAPQQYRHSLPPPLVVHSVQNGPPPQQHSPPPPQHVLHSIPPPPLPQMIHHHPIQQQQQQQPHLHPHSHSHHPLPHHMGAGHPGLPRVHQEMYPMAYTTNAPGNIVISSSNSHIVRKRSFEGEDDKSINSALPASSINPKRKYKLKKTMFDPMGNPIRKKSSTSLSSSSSSPSSSSTSISTPNELIGAVGTSVERYDKCLHCNSTETPEWRKGPSGERTLCNACGLFFAKLCKRYGDSTAITVMRERKERGNYLDRRVSISFT